MDRSLPARRRMDRVGCDLRASLRRGSCTAGRNAPFPLGRSNYRHGRTLRSVFFVRHGCGASRRTAAVTAPFSPEAWSALDAVGEAIDADLRQHNVRLTMGGEPTFVSIDDYQSAEWNTTALGSNKRKCADELIRRLRNRFAPGGLLHYGQGKWYPGESNPRWALALYWRRDGAPIWHDDSLIARETDRRASSGDARLFAEGIAARLGFSTDYAQPVYEDPVDRLLKGNRIAENIDPGDPKIHDPVERARILKLFDSKLGRPAGFVLPLQHWTAAAGPEWMSEIWSTRRGRLFLVPGESPLGLRLPMQSLPSLHPAE